MTDYRVPINYQTPAFPSLYNPFPRPNAPVYYLYYTRDIWRFTLYWTLIFYLASHLSVAAWALAMQGRGWRIYIAIPLAYGVIAGLEALLAGSIIGLVLGTVYEAGNFRMSTWIPMIWGSINMLVLILSSYPMQGGL
ncbi:integral membrane protein [Aspergillus bertholletiae]|uniref:Integral membrane protein n=1 Tax=Aspergillus bertholletiae TaxID=1226010 RepID=A0A5N7BNJ5_9EURO|nr:integral membrane protein [Aspergillus bertholletiae]